MTDENENAVYMKAPTSRTLSDYTSDQLRSSILSGYLRPNQRLVEHQIAKSMKTSRGPVREALRKLEAEGLVKRESHRGTYVTSLAPKDVEEIYTLREALETLAVKYAIENASGEQIQELEQIIAALKEAIQGDKPIIEATEIDLCFHRTLCKIAGHQRLLAAWEVLSPQIQLVFMGDAQRDPNIYKKEGVEWHARLVEAIKNRDIDEALSEVNKHMYHSVSWILDSTIT